MITIENIIESESAFKNKRVTFELLRGGYVNKTYKLKCDGKSYCVRITNDKQSRFFKLNTVKEAEACMQASQFNIAPAIYNINNASEYLITDFFEGKFLSKDEVDNPIIIEKYINAIKVIHCNVKVDRVFSAFDIIDNYIKGAKINQIPLPESISTILKRVEQIRKIRDDSKLLKNVFCHNDIWNNNILYDGHELRIIDWEFCGFGDGLFDLAHISNINKTTFEVEKLMLKTYFSYFEIEIWNMLQQMKYISRVIDGIWYFFHAGISDDDNQKSFYLEHGNNAIEELVK